MIDLNQPPVRTAGLVLFADDERPPVWHVVPDQPALGMLANGRPACVLIKYRLDPSRDWPRGGGLLHLQCELRLSNQALAQARSVLIAQGGAMQNIVPLQPDRATCELLVWPGEADGGPSIVTATPAFQPPFDASFHVPLSMEGVTLFEHALTSGQSPATLTYRLAVTARRPQLPAKVTIDWRSVAEMTSETPGTGVDRLIERGVIRIEITGSAGPDPAAMKRVTEEVLHLVTARQPASAEGRKTTRFDLAQPREEETVIVASATLTQLLEGLGPNGRAESLVAVMEEVSHG